MIKRLVTFIDDANVPHLILFYYIKVNTVFFSIELYTQICNYRNADIILFWYMIARGSWISKIIHIIIVYNYFGWTILSVCVFLFIFYWNGLMYIKQATVFHLYLIIDKLLYSYHKILVLQYRLYITFQLSWVQFMR